jgi:hypothetical protein
VPGLNVVGLQVVEDEMHLEIDRHAALGPIEEGAELDAAVGPIIVPSLARCATNPAVRRTSSESLLLPGQPPK